MATVQVRYIVNDVDAAITFYCQHLGFTEVMHPSPMFAMLSRGDLRLVLSQPGGQNVGGGSTLADGRKPEPGGWNRFAIEVDDLGDMVERLRGAGVQFCGWNSSIGLPEGSSTNAWLPPTPWMMSLRKRTPWPRSSSTVAARSFTSS